MKPLLLASAVLLTSWTSTPALAQEMSWTGAYFGGRLGYSSQPNDNDETILFDNDLDGEFGDTVNTVAGTNAFSRGFCGGATTSATSTGCFDRDGTDWAAHIGYDVQLGRSILVGAVAEYGRSTIVDSVTAFSTTPAFYTFSRRLRDNASLRAKLGLALGRTAVYTTGGLAYGKVRHSFSTSNAANTFTQSGADDRAYGYRVGGGIEQRTSDNFSIGLQYLYTSLKDDGFTVRAGGTGVPVSNAFILRNAMGTDFRRSSERFNTHNLSVTTNFRF